MNGCWPRWPNQPANRIRWRASGFWNTPICVHMSAKKANDDGSQSKELTVVNKLGIHARPAAMFVKTANRFTCDILVEKDGETVNGKSIMGLMMLAAGPGSRLILHADGPDAHNAVVEIEALLHRKFDED